MWLCLSVCLMRRSDPPPLSLPSPSFFHDTGFTTRGSFFSSFPVVVVHKDSLVVPPHTFPPLVLLLLLMIGLLMQEEVAHNDAAAGDDDDDGFFFLLNHSSSGTRLGDARDSDDWDRETRRTLRMANAKFGEDNRQESRGDQQQKSSQLQVMKQEPVTKSIPGQQQRGLQSHHVHLVSILIPRNMPPIPENVVISNPKPKATSGPTSHSKGMTDSRPEKRGSEERPSYRCHRRQNSFFEPKMLSL